MFHVVLYGWEMHHSCLSSWILISYAFLLGGTSASELSDMYFLGAFTEFTCYEMLLIRMKGQLSGESKS